MQVLDDFTLTVPRDQWTGGSEVAGFTGSLEIYMKKYMDPCQVDPMMKMEKDLDETKIILHRSIEAVLERDEKLHDLVAKSDELSEGSKMFYKTVPKQGCCSSLNWRKIRENAKFRICRQNLLLRNRITNLSQAFSNFLEKRRLSKTNYF